MRLDDAITEYLNFSRARRLSRHTIRNREQTLRFYRDFAGNPRLKRIRRGDLTEFASYMAEYVSPRTGKPLRDTTIHLRLTELNTFYEFCVAQGYCGDNPAAHLEVQVEPVDVSTKTIPLQDLVKTVAWVRTELSRNVERSLFILVALADCALRAGEVARLQTCHVDLDNRVLSTRRKHRRHQYLPVSPIFVWAYQEWLRVRPKTGHDYVLCAVSHPHQNIQAASITNCVRYWTFKATGRQWGPHAFRHAWISQALNRAGIPPHVVKDIAGHNDLKTTQEYATPDLDAQRAAIDRGPLLSHVFPSGISSSPAIGADDDGNVTITVDVSDWFGR